MEQEHIYIGIRRRGIWHVYHAEQVQETDLDGIDAALDLQSTIVIGHEPARARAQIVWQDTFDHNPYTALQDRGHTSRGLELVRECVRRHASRHVLALRLP